MQQRFLDKAKENLLISRFSFEQGFFNACANRSYYAAFQAAVAALLDRGIKKGKFDHKWVQSQFSERLIKRQKIYPAGMKSYLTEMQLIRNRADYEPHFISRKTAHRQMSKAVEIIDCVVLEIGK